MWFPSGHVSFGFALVNFGALWILLSLSGGEGKTVAKSSGKPRHRHEKSEKLNNSLKKTKGFNRQPKTKKQLNEDLNKILDIDDESKFKDTVLQLMKDDDADVLKNSNEDEPFGKSKKVDKKNQTTHINHVRSQIPQPRSETQQRHQYEDALFTNTNDADRTLATGNHDDSRSQRRQSIQKPNPKVYYIPWFPPYAPAQQRSNFSTFYGDLGSAQVSNPQKEIKPSRVCKPGVVKPVNPFLPNCLIIGDSIGLSYSYSVAAALKGRCQVQLAPFSKAGVALDSAYGLHCLPMLLSTADLKPTRYDAIIFNFGLHDIDYLNEYPEEFNNVTNYARNLGRIKKRLLSTGAGVAFALTTPVTYDKLKNEKVKIYNAIAKRVMAKTNPVTTIDLYQIVIDQCGQIPFDNCYMMKRPMDVHYGIEGSITLGKWIASEFIKLLGDKSILTAPDNKLRALNLNYVNLTNPLYDLEQESIACPLPTTRCPKGTTCFKNAVSKTGYGCCMVDRATDCGDNWHCCPEKTKCHPECSETWCQCLLL